jgi:hypothetical protein
MTLRCALLFSCFLSLITAISAQNIAFDSTRLPIVRLYTNGQNIPDEPKITASMSIIAGGNWNRPNDAPNAYNGRVGVERRGSSSQYFYEKKAYSLELRDAQGNERSEALLGMPAESDWALIQPLNDKTLIRDAMAYELARQTMDWAPRTRFVELMIDDRYEGVYMLVEMIRRNKNRVNVPKLPPSDTATDISGGYILAFDKMPGSQVGGDWRLPTSPIPFGWQNTWVQFIYPRRENATPEQKGYIRNYINDFDRLMVDLEPNLPGEPAYNQYIHPESWADYFLVNEIAKNIDAFRLSAYFYKDRDDNGPYSGKIHMGPVWDFNISMGIGDYCNGNDYTGWVTDFNEYCGQDQWVIHHWWPKMISDVRFQALLQQRYRALREGAWSDARILYLTDSLVSVLDGARQRNFQRWPVMGIYVWPNSFVGKNYEEEIAFLKRFLLDRARWMDGNLQRIGPNPVRYVEGMKGPVSFFPNPTTDGRVVLEYNLPPDAGLTLRVWDMSGRMAYETQLPTDRAYHYPLELSSVLKNGVHVVQIISGDRVIQAGKLIWQE